MDKEIKLLLEWHDTFIVESHEEVVLHEGTEVEGESKFLKLTGIFQKGNFPNGNGRVYPTKLLEREVKRFQTKITKGTSLGKAYHPDWYMSGAGGTQDVSHRITKLEMDGDTVRGELIVFNTVSGKDVQNIIDGGGTLGISSRGRGGSRYYDKATYNGKTFKNVEEIQDNYRLTTFDLVLDPSVGTAFLKPVKNKKESTENKNEDNEKPEGDYNMTVEELKKSFPVIYSAIRAEGIEEGTRLTKGVAKTEQTEAVAEVTSSKDLLIEGLNKDKTELTAKVEEVGKENEALKSDLEKTKSEKLALDISKAVKEAVDKFEFKSYIEDKDIADICKAESVEAAIANLNSHIAIIKKTVEQVNKGTTIVQNGVNVDSSTSGGTSTTTDELVQAENQRQVDAAFGG